MPRMLPPLRLTDFQKVAFIARAKAEQANRRAPGVWTSIELLEEAVRLDPTSADALGELAMARLLVTYWDSSLSTADVLRLEEASDSAGSAALALNPTDIEALVAAAAILTGHYEFEEAEALYLRALEVQPGSALVFNWYGDLLQYAGRGPEAVAMEGRAAALDPLYRFTAAGLA